MVTIINDEVTDLRDPADPTDAMTLNAAQGAIASLPITYSAGTQKTSVKQFCQLVTINGGTGTIYLTDNGLIGGNALFPNEILYVNIYGNDPNNTFGLGHAISNSNKTLTLTVNSRSFATVTVLGISVLGSTTLTAAPNGTVVGVHVIGR